MTRKKIRLLLLAFLAFFLFLLALWAGSSRMSVWDCIKALGGKGDASAVRIVRNIRLPRAIAALLAGAALSLAGHILQTVLANPMASPGTLGVSGGAVFGANLSILLSAGGFVAAGNNLQSYSALADPYSASLLAFCFSLLSVLLILGLCRLRAYHPGTVVLAGIALGFVWSAATTLLQYYTTDVGLSAGVIWSFGDLGRATFETDGILLAALLLSCAFFFPLSLFYNALLSGDDTAVSLGINLPLLRFFSLLFASLLTGVCVSFLGVIGFVGIICPHVSKKLLGQDHRFSLPASALIGSSLLLASDILARTVGKGSAMPVGAVTSLLGAPFFLALIFCDRRKSER